MIESFEKTSCDMVKFSKYTVKPKNLKQSRKQVFQPVDGDYNKEFIVKYMVSVVSLGCINPLVGNETRVSPNSGFLRNLEVLPAPKPGFGALQTWVF